MNDGGVNIGNAEIVARGNYTAVLEQIRDEGKCPFCEDQLPRHHTKPILWTSDHWTVTTNAWPYKGTRLHFLLISNKHLERIEDLPAPARSDFFANFDRLSREYELEGASILWRSGETQITGATVKHLHAQIIVGYPRAEGAEVITGLLGFKET
jgi:diadenosine tetraphosphate (Ap4A) HIT family hydrolase